MKENKILWLAVNAKYSHTSLSVRYLREAVPGSEIMELTINHQLLAMLGEIYSARPKVLGISCYIWNIEYIERIVDDFHKVCPAVPIYLGGPEVMYKGEQYLKEHPQIEGIIVGEGEIPFERLVAFYDREGSIDEIPGIVRRRENGSIVKTDAPPFISLDEIPLPMKGRISENQIIY